MQAFDELLLLKRGGRTIYCGPTGHESQQLVQYFESHRGVNPIPAGTNPASWMLEVRLPGTLRMHSWAAAFHACAWPSRASFMCPRHTNTQRSICVAHRSRSDTSACLLGILCKVL